MHVPTHLLSGWCVANCFPLNARERLFCMIAASACDADGLSVLGGWEAYQDYHHLLAHNLPFIALTAGVLTIFSSHRALAFVLYVGLGHLHLLMDYYGSGPGWKIYYLWPFSHLWLRSDNAWE